MPELPDVETVVRLLRRTVQGRRIRDVQVLTRSTVHSPAIPQFVRRLRGRTIRRVSRRGKYILVSLSDGRTLAVHLRMTGGFEVVPRAHPVHPHTRVVFRMGRQDLRFVDQRRLGHMDLVDAGVAFAPLRRLGVDPLGQEFTLLRLRALVRGRRGAIKSLLLRQDLIAGVGNIYADEILWQARIHPRRAAASLRPEQAARLYRAIRGVLRRAVTGLARHGRPVGRLLEVRRQDAPCPRCGRPLSVRPIAGRTTYFCARCQR